MLRSIVDFGNYIGGFFLRNDEECPYYFIVINKNEKQKLNCEINVKISEGEKKILFQIYRAYYYGTNWEVETRSPFIDGTIIAYSDYGFKKEEFVTKVLENIPSTEYFFYNTLEEIKKILDIKNEIKILDFNKNKIFQLYNSLVYQAIDLENASLDNYYDYSNLVKYFFGNKIIFNNRLTRNKTLKLSGKIPEIIKTCTFVEKLILNGPQENLNVLNKLHKLKYLEIKGDSIEELPRIKGLETLILDISLFHYVDLYNFPKLKKLHILNNFNLGGFPLQILNLKELVHLQIINCNIDCLPDSICALNDLKTLDLKFNELIEIPEFITLLENLEILDLSDNNLLYLPEKIFYEMDNLKEIRLKNNPGLNKERIKDAIKAIDKTQKLKVYFD